MKKLETALLFGLTLLTTSLLAQGEIRTFDGSNNNLRQPHWGAVHSQLGRIAAPDYEDQISIPAGSNRPNPRVISNALFAQADKDGNPLLINNHLELSDFVWGFGQFLDHDISLSDPNEEPFMIPVNFPDRHFNPTGTLPNVMIRMNRTKYLAGTGTDPNNPRQHFNEISSWIDGSLIYGSDAYTATWLRTGKGGKLKTAKGDLLPYNTLSGEKEDAIDIDAPQMDNLGRDSILFVAGEIRANENILLTAMHTLFVREHNRLCEEYAKEYPNWTDEQLYQKIRKIVGGQIQAITYEEWLPTVGIPLSPYTGYNADIDPSVLNVFSAAAFRVGHTLINGNINRVDVVGNPHPDGPFSLREGFFQPSVIQEEGIKS